MSTILWEAMQSESQAGQAHVSREAGKALPILRSFVWDQVNDKEMSPLAGLVVQASGVVLRGTSLEHRF